MQLKLIVLGGNKAGDEIMIPGPKFFVGRENDCHLRPRSDMISRHHCALIVEPGYAAIRDFGSKNGTFVNGERVSMETELSHGDELLIGPLRFRVEMVHQVGGPKRSKVKDVQEAASRTAEMPQDGNEDISSWLEDDKLVLAPERGAPESNAPQSSAAKTEPPDSTPLDEQVSLGDTTELKLDDTDLGLKAAPQNDSEPALEKTKKGKPEQTKSTKPGKLPRFKTPKAVDTQAVAEDVLRQIVRQKKQQEKGQKTQARSK